MGLGTASLLVGASGFAGGAVFLPAVIESMDPTSLVSLASAGFAGSAVFILIWLVTASILAGILTKSRQEGRFGMARRLSAWYAASFLPLISYFPYLLYRSQLDGVSVELPPLGSRSSAILLLFWSILLLAFLLRLAFSEYPSKWLNRLNRYPGLSLGLMIAAWLIIFFPLDVLKARYMHVTTVNSALFRDAMLQVFDDRGFMFSSLLYSSGASLFSVHINAIFVFLVPLFRILPDYRWLLLIGDVALALSAWPAYLIARRRFAPALSLLIAAMVLLNPIMTAQPGRSDFSEVRFVPLLFLTAFYLFEKKSFWIFAAASFLLMTVREDMGLFAAGFGIYALMQRRSLKWILAPLAWGLGWFGLTVAVLLPRIGPSDTAVRLSLRYGNLGSSGGEIAKTLLLRPWKAVQAALSTSSHIGAVYGIVLISGLGIAFLSGAAIFALPAAAELLFQQTTTFTNFMAVPLVPTLAVAFTLGLDRLANIGSRRLKVSAARIAAVAGIVALFVSASAFHTWFNPGLYQPRYNYEAAIEAFDAVPADAKVIMPEFMLAYAGTKQTVRGYHQVRYEETIEGQFVLTEDYVILDRRRPDRLASDNRYYDGLDEVASIVETTPGFSKVYSRDDIELYIRDGSSPM